jgi:4-amino-4-deoxy-L-arabinose transferase-like glycosyltransferase
MHPAPDDRALRPTDYLLLTVLSAVLALPAFISGRGLTTHEATHCLNVREMFESGDYLIPTYGGRPWLERPPVPHWLTGLPAFLANDPYAPWAMRIGPVLAGTAGVLVFAWAVAGALGRRIGLMSGAVMATTREWAAYTTGPEADIFLAAAVTLVGSLILRADFGPRSESRDRETFFGRRPWPVLGVFLVLGLTNAMKGPLFGTVFIASALGVYVFLGRDWAALRRYVWFWGWLAYFATGLLWPVASYLRHPDVTDVWLADYVKRLNEGYIKASWWYYLVHVPWNLFPWTIPALTGLAVTARRVFRDRDRPWQFLWAWALVPPILLSAFQGKHHHYMLNCLAPWCPLAVVGAVALWQVARDWPGWLRSPLFGLVAFGVPGAVAALALGDRIPGPDWMRYAIAGGWIVVAALGWMFMTHRDGRTAFVGLIVVIVVVNSAAFLYRTVYLDRYEADAIFLADVRDSVPTNTPVYVINENDPLNAAWVLYEIGPRARLLHHWTWLSGERITEADVYVVGRRRDEPALTGFGTVERLGESTRTRGESSAADRYTLFRIHFHPDLVRLPEPTLTALEATGKTYGPEMPKPRRQGPPPRRGRGIAACP